jgi:U3 small nucleolar RNA-associated protein 23
MIMEPMAGETSENREREERGKFRAGLKRRTPRGRMMMMRERSKLKGGASTDMW